MTRFSKTVSYVLLCGSTLTLASAAFAADYGFTYSDASVAAEAETGIYQTSSDSGSSTGAVVQGTVRAEGVAAAGGAGSTDSIVSASYAVAGFKARASGGVTTNKGLIGTVKADGYAAAGAGLAGAACLPVAIGAGAGLDAQGEANQFGRMSDQFGRISFAIPVVVPISTDEGYVLVKPFVGGVNGSVLVSNGQGAPTIANISSGVTSGIGVDLHLPQFTAALDSVFDSFGQTGLIRSRIGTEVGIPLTALEDRLGFKRIEVGGRADVIRYSGPRDNSQVGALAGKGVTEVTATATLAW